jgi:acetylornithine/succinyldiaminopimelate/putrescine aminotransferase
MMEFMPSQKIPWKDGNKLEIVDYKQPHDELEAYELFLDDGSFHVKSQAVVAKIAENLMARGALPVGKGLEMIGYPDADKVQKELEQQQALAAVTAVSQGTGGRGGRR